MRCRVLTVVCMIWDVQHCSLAVSSSDMLEPIRLHVVTSHKATILKKIGNAQGKTILENSSSHSKKKNVYL